MLIKFLSLNNLLLFLVALFISTSLIYSEDLFIEIDSHQSIKTKKMLNLNGFYVNEICKDLSGKDRCIISTKI